MEHITENKRIAKNSLFLFARMIVTLLVGLYTSRVILSALGVSDFGIYNVVGSVVVMFVFINTAMVNSTQRYVTYELGCKDEDRLNRVFVSSLNIHAIISLVILVLCETLGLWFFYHKMVIPEERLSSAFWVYQLSVLSCVVNIMSVPYNALIIAHEKMSAFAYISLLDAFLKLLIAYVLTVYNDDRLVLYGILLFFITLLERYIYGRYCRLRFKESKYNSRWDITLTLDMTKFAMWNLFGNFSYACYTQGLNLLLNVFFSPAINAARGLSVQVQSAISNFSYNIENAIKPQITKAYAQNNYERMHNLIGISARMSFYMLLMISLPIFLRTDQVLDLWLKEVPEHTSNFVRLTIMILWAEAIANPLLTAVQATGKIKKYQLWVSLLSFMILPCSYFALKINPCPEYVYLVSLSIEIIMQFVKIYIVGKQIGLSIRRYLKDVCMRIISVLILAIALTIPLSVNLDKPNLVNLIVVTLVCSSVILLGVWIIGITQTERNSIKARLIGFVKILNNNKRQ